MRIYLQKRNINVLWPIRKLRRHLLPGLGVFKRRNSHKSGTTYHLALCLQAHLQAQTHFCYQKLQHVFILNANTSQRINIFDDISHVRKVCKKTRWMVEKSIFLSVTSYNCSTMKEEILPHFKAPCSRLHISFAKSILGPTHGFLGSA